MSSPVRLKGKIAAAGMARGRARILPDIHQIVPRSTVADPSAEWERVAAALAGSKEQITALLERSNLIPELEQIFEAQLMLLDDPMLRDEVSRRIRDENVNGEWALARAVARFKSLMAERSDAFFQERLLDLDDVVGRVIANLMGTPGGDLRVPFVQNLPPDTILIGDDLPPSLMLRLSANVVGIALEQGGLTGHTAILARNRGIPALVGVKGLLTVMKRAQESGALLDAVAGEIVFEPDEEDLTPFTEYRSNSEGNTREPIASPLVLADGTEVSLLANMDRREDCLADRARFVAGTGLFRTEFLYMRDPELLHSVAAGAAVYAGILENMGDRPVTFRLLDLGGDKSLFELGGTAFAPRENFPGGELRGLALLLAHRPLLESQLEAVLRATVEKSGTGRARLLLPMVRGVEEVRQFHTVLTEVRAKLAREGVESPALPVGLMIETPGAAVMADVFARHADFLSIGSNDLARFALPLDPGAEEAGATAFYEPSVLRLIDLVVRRAGVPVALCGELAGIPGMLPVLIGLGLRELSMALTVLPRPSPALARLDRAACEELARRAIEAETSEEVRTLVEAFD